MSKFPYRYGPRRNKSIQEAHRLRGIFEGTRTFVMNVFVLCDLLDELKQQTHLARQYERALRELDGAEARDLKRRIRLARKTLHCPGGDEHTAACRLLDLRRPLPKRGGR